MSSLSLGLQSQLGMWLQSQRASWLSTFAQITSPLWDLPVQAQVEQKALAAQGFYSSLQQQLIIKLLPLARHYSKPEMFNKAATSHI